MPQTSATGLYVPTSGDAPDIASIHLTQAADLDKVTVPLFASTSARDAAYATTAFKLCVVGASVDAGTLYMRQGGNWIDMTAAVRESSATVPLTSGFTGSATVYKTSLHTIVQGSITGSFTSGVTTQVASLPAGYSPPFPLPFAANYSNGESGWGRVNNTASIEVRKPTSGSSTLMLTALWHA